MKWSDINKQMIIIWKSNNMAAFTMFHQNKDDIGGKGYLDLGGTLEKSEGDLVTQNGKQVFA